MIRYLKFFCLAGILWACGEPESKLFLDVSDQSGIEFSNTLEFDQDFNIFKYRNYYNGGGVALIDYNNDGLLDIYLVANMASNRLFQNQGDLKFKDVTEQTMVGGTRAWSTGASAVDINADGWMDLYVCNSGDISGDNKQNEFFINNGDGSFSEQAEEMQLADRGFSTHAAFFDYDKDGDLDMYLLNNSYQAIGSFNLRRNERPNRDEVGGDKLFQNNDGVFSDVSDDAGIYGSIIGFGLGVTVGDVDDDGWQDIYVSNDFFERDYLYINQKDGTFSEVLTQSIKSVSAASMGADMADLNNDARPEIFVTDMLPKTNDRIKTVTTFDSWDRYRYSVDNGYWHQFTRNTLQLNNGDGTFSEIGRFAGVEGSDWSWGALIFDFQNDGKKDIFVANGIYQDLTNQDFLQFAAQEEVIKKVTGNNEVDYKELVSYIPSVPVPNHAYINSGKLSFIEAADSLGLGEPGFSSGSAYGDLDNDGDLDLVVNNTNMPFSLYENRSDVIASENHYIRFVLEGNGENVDGFGAKIKIFRSGDALYIEQLPTRGFQSSVDFRPLVGVGQTRQLDSVVVLWPSGREQTLTNVPVDTTIQLKEVNASENSFSPSSDGSVWYSKIEKVDYQHQENAFVDFDRDRLTFQMLSTQGPCLCKGDINGDQLDDFYIGGAAGQSGSLYIQTSSGEFSKADSEIFESSSSSEDTDCAFFDQNGDGLLDLYVASGGNEFESSSELNDRIYLNLGNSNFERLRQNLPTDQFESTSVVETADFNGDGKMDLFVGIRLRPYFYGYPMNGYILESGEDGKMKNTTESVAPGLQELGLITDAKWTDLDGDQDLDLVVVGEWMPVRVFVNEDGLLTLQDNLFSGTNGWYNAIETADINSDGLDDLVLANHGLNSRFKASSEKPLEMFVNDFDRNGTIEQIICQYNGEKSYPLPLRHDLSMQMPHVKKKYLKYENYKDQTIQDIFTEQEMEGVLKLESFDLSSKVYLNKGSMEFEQVELPSEIQYSCAFSVHVDDFNNDGNVDLLFGGNLYNVKPEMGRYDASYGAMVIGNGKGNFEYVSPASSGVYIDGEVREILSLSGDGNEWLVVANNNDSLEFFLRENR